MAYRLYVINSKNETMQIFGNNDYPEEEIIKELKNQGLTFKESFHDFKISNLQPLINIIKNYIENCWYKYQEEKILNEKYDDCDDCIINLFAGQSIADWTRNFTKKSKYKFECSSLYTTTKSIVKLGKIFILFNLIEFLKDDLDINKTNQRKDLFVLKDDANVRFSLC